MVAGEAVGEGVAAVGELPETPMISVRPLVLRTTFQVSGASTVTDRVVPKRAGWSEPSAVTVSTLSPEKMRSYLLGPTALTFI